jgi:hypothetical protein
MDKEEMLTKWIGRIEFRKQEEKMAEKMMKHYTIRKYK